MNEGSPLSDTEKFACKNRMGKIGLITGDALAVLRTLPTKSFNVAVTSPPYYWARDYGVDGQIGHEDSVEEFVSSLADVFDEVHRVLDDEGVFFLNIGDTYYSGNGQPHGSDPRSSSRNFMRKKLRAVDRSGWSIPKKSLIGVPWKVAFEMQSRGWTLRSSIIWNRMNSFVEPTARDRPHRQHENLFMFSKSRFYSFDRKSLVEEDVWNIPIERDRKIDHNAKFPAELVKRCVVAASPERGSVLDPFVGSGTTLRTANSLGRDAVGIELNPKYAHDVAESLITEGMKEIKFETLLKSISPRPSTWDSWTGNKINFVKPKQKRKSIK